MSSALGGERKVDGLFDFAGATTSISKDLTYKKRSVSSPIHISPKTADEQSNCARYLPEAKNVLALGKSTTLAPLAPHTVEQKLSRLTLTPSNAGRTPPLKNNTSTTLPPIYGPTGSPEAVEREVVYKKMSGNVPTISLLEQNGSDYRELQFKDIITNIERKKEQKCPEIMALSTLSGVSPGNIRVNSSPKEIKGFDTIPEGKLPIPSSPTVVTVELAAAAKIFLETYYNEILREPTPRALRIHHLKSQLYVAKNLTAEVKQCYLDAFYKAGTDHLRETRVLKARSMRSLLFDDGERSAMPHAKMCAAGFETLKLLGKGSFGTVRLVREKALPYDDPATARKKKKQLYAMKMIRKSEMIRYGQEGHIRAERDFLVSSEGSNW